MIKSGLRIFCFVLLCFLLVYAPEIYTTVSTQYAAAQPMRTLLRISLCAQDPASEKAILNALHLYMKEFPSVHLRIARLGADQLFTQPDPQADVFIFPSDLPAPDAQFLRSAVDGQMCYAVYGNTNLAEASDALVSYLLTAASLDSEANSAL